MKQFEIITKKINENDITGLERMFKRGANVNFKMKDDLSYLMYAVSKECPAAIKLLIKYNADILAQDAIGRDFIYYYFYYLNNAMGNYIFAPYLMSNSVSAITTTGVFLGKTKYKKTLVGNYQNIQGYYPKVKLKNKYSSALYDMNTDYNLMKKCLSNYNIQNKIFNQLPSENLIETVLMFNKHEMLHKKLHNKFSYIITSDQLNLL